MCCEDRSSENCDVFSYRGNGSYISKLEGSFGDWKHGRNRLIKTTVFVQQLSAYCFERLWYIVHFLLSRLWWHSKVAPDPKPTAVEALQRSKRWPWPQKLVVDVLCPPLHKYLLDSNYSAGLSCPSKRVRTSMSTEEQAKDKPTAASEMCGNASWRIFLITLLAGPTQEGEEVPVGEPSVFSVSPRAEAGGADHHYGDLGHSEGWQT